MQNACPESLCRTKMCASPSTRTGTHLRMEQSGFRPDQQQAHQGAKGGWQRFFANLEQALARMD